MKGTPKTTPDYFCSQMTKLGIFCKRTTHKQPEQAGISQNNPKQSGMSKNNLEQSRIIWKK